MKHFFTDPFRLVYINAALISKTVFDEIRRKNVGTILGIWWLCISPACFLAIYSVVYLFIFKFRPLDMSAQMYLLHIFGGLLPFMFHSEALSLGVVSLKANRSLLKSTAFPAEIIPLKSVLSSTPSLVFGMIFVLIGTIIYGHPTVYLLFVFLFIFLQALFLIGVCWILSLANLIVKDIQNLIVFLNMMLMIGSPIAYTVDMVPPSFRFIVWLNPVSYFVICNQTLIRGELPPLNLTLTICMFSLTSFILGFNFFHSMKRSILTYV